ncbi:uncharacterized protein LOC142340944 [Convolutriloba macropyga]|uniref:uncharacterized protein LOC142340944 n=1 Tax=Convolutriloba macropyga TaxID=536237 RepID=UPI003F51B7F8
MTKTWKCGNLTNPWHGGRNLTCSINTILPCSSVPASTKILRSGETLPERTWGSMSGTQQTLCSREMDSCVCVMPGAEVDAFEFFKCPCSGNEMRMFICSRKGVYDSPDWLNLDTLMCKAGGEAKSLKSTPDLVRAP